MTDSTDTVAMTKYEQTREVAGRVVSQYSQMLQNLSDEDTMMKSNGGNIEIAEVTQDRQQEEDT